MIKFIATFLLNILVFTNLFSQEQLTHINTVEYWSYSSPQFLGTINDKAIFTTPDGLYEGFNIYVTDGTDGGTQLIQHLNTYHGVKTLQPFSNGEYVYFVTHNPAVYSYVSFDLWRTDGTTQGTGKVVNGIASYGLNHYENLAGIYLFTTAEFIYVTVHDKVGQTTIRKFNHDFQEISSQTDVNSTVMPTFFNNQIFVKAPYTFQVGAAEVTTINKGDFVIDNTLYRTYSNDLSKAYSNTPNPTIIGAVNTLTGNETKTYILRLTNDTSRTINACEYFAYNKELYALVISSEKGTSVGGTADLYQLNKATGFEIKRSYQLNSAISFAFTDIKGIWQKESILNIISGSSEYQHLAIDLKTYQSEVVKTIENKNSVNQILKGVFELKTDSNSVDKVLYNADNRIEIPLENTSVDFQAEVSPDKWFVALRRDKGLEAYFFDLSNGEFSLIKDLRPGGSGISTLTPHNGQLLWTSPEAKGLMLYKSDGTRAGTKLLSNISTTIPENYTGNQSIAKFDDEIVYTNTPNTLGYNQFSYLHYATNGNDKAIKLFESKKFLYGSAVLKTNDRYYIMYTESKSPLVLKLIRISLDGKEERTTTIDLSSKNYVARDDKIISIVADKYFLISTTYPASPVIDPATGEIINSNEVYAGSFRGKIFFNTYNENETVSKRSVYVYENSQLIKLFEMNKSQYPTISSFSGKEFIVFQDSENFHITDGTFGNIKKVTGLDTGFTVNHIKSINNGYLFQDLYNTKWQIYKDGIIKKTSLSPPQIGLNEIRIYNKNELIYDNKLYFFWFNTNSELIIYSFDENEVVEEDNLGIFSSEYPEIQMNSVEGGFWLNFRKFPYQNDYTLMLWKPNVEVVKIAEGDIMMCGFLPDNKMIFKKYHNKSNQSGKYYYKLYVSDGKAQPQLLSEQEFMDRSSQTNSFAVLSNKLYFSASTPETGSEPWETDGSVAGTRMVGDLLKGPEDSFPSSFMEVKGNPVCLAYTPDLGTQLFSLKTTLSAPLLALPNNQACEGDSIILTAGKDFDTYTWIINDKDEIKTTTNTFTVTQSGNYKVIVSKGTASSLPSNTASINFIPLPARPVIVSNNNQLTVITESKELQWYLNGTAIPGAISKSIIYAGAGNYTVKVTDKGCSSISDALFFTVTSREDENLIMAEVFPNPADDRLIIKLNEDKPVTFELIDMQGRVILRDKTKGTRHEIAISHLPPGVYLLKWKEKSKKILIE